MPLDTLRDVFRRQLADAYDAEQQLVGMLDRIEMDADSTALRDRVRQYRAESVRRLDNLARSFELVGATPPRQQNELVRAVRAAHDAFTAATPSGPALEAFNIDTIGRLASYKTGMYRLLANLAAVVGEDDVRRLMEQNLREEESLWAWVAAHHEELLTGYLAPARARDPVRGIQVAG